MLALARIPNAVELGPTSLGNRGAVGLLAPFEAFTMPGLGLHERRSFAGSKIWEPAQTCVEVSDFGEDRNYA